MDKFIESYSLFSKGINIFFVSGVVTQMIEKKFHTDKSIIIASHLNTLTGICLVLNQNTCSLNTVLSDIFSLITLDINIRDMKNNVHELEKRWKYIKSTISHFLEEKIFKDRDEKKILKELSKRLYIFVGSDIINEYTQKSDVLNAILYSISIIGITENNFKINEVYYNNIKIPNFKNTITIFNENTVLIGDSIDGFSFSTVFKKSVKHNNQYKILFNTSETKILKKSFSRYIIRDNSTYKKIFNEGLENSDIFFKRSPSIVDNKNIDWFEQQIFGNNTTF